MPPPLQPRQLRMFMTPREIVGEMDRFNDQRPNQAFETLMGYKRQAAETPGARTGGRIEEGPTLAESIRTEGVQKPVEIRQERGGEQTFMEGHHRLAVSLEHAPDQPIPVTHVPPLHGW